MMYQEEINELQSILIKTEKILKDTKEEVIQYFPSLLKLFEEAVKSGEFTHANRLGALQYYRMAVNNKAYNSDWQIDVELFVDSNLQKLIQEKFAKKHQSQLEELGSRYINVYNKIAGKIGMRAVDFCPPPGWNGCWIWPYPSYLIISTPLPLLLLNSKKYFLKFGCEYIKLRKNACINYDIYSNYEIYHMRESNKALKEKLEELSNAES